MSTDLDAITIGAGHNSLACACHLAKRGWKVAVYEQASEPGGAVKSGADTNPGFTHDWAAMNLSLFAGSAFHTENAAELAEHGLAFAPSGNPFATLFPDGRWLWVSDDTALTTARVRGFSQRDADTWQRLTDDFPAQAEAIFSVLGSPMNAKSLGKLGWFTWRKQGAGGALDLARFLMLSPHTFWEGEDTLNAIAPLWGEADEAKRIAGWKAVDKRIAENAEVIQRLEYVQPILHDARVKVTPHRSGALLPHLMTRA